MLGGMHPNTYVYARVFQGTSVVVGEQFAEFILYQIQGLDSDFQAWLKVPLYTKLSHWLYNWAFVKNN